MARHRHDHRAPRKVEDLPVADLDHLARAALLAAVAEAVVAEAAVAEAVVGELAGRLEATDGSVEELVRAYRRFAWDHPEGFRLMLTLAAPPEALGRAAAPVLRACGRLVGESHALDAARLVTAWATGFIGMELAGGFRLGGDVDRSFEYGLARMRRALGGDPQAPGVTRR